MSKEITFEQAVANFESIYDEVSDGGDSVIINRRGSESVALIAASELRSLLETVHLLRSPKNAERLMTALDRARR